MPSHSGPNTNEEGLVFSFDVNDYNSFKGQPGINLGSGPNFGYSGSGLSEYENGKLIRWKSYTEKVHIPTLGVKDVKTIEWYNIYSGYGTDGNYTCCPTIFTYSPSGWNSTILEPSTEYMYQIIYKSASGYTNANYMYHYERSADDSQGTEFGVHSTGRRTHLGDGWYHAWGSFTTQSYTVKGYFGCWHYEYNTKNKVSLAAVSLIKGNSVRPPAQFIDEGVTLSNTEALLDLTGNSTIDISNATFDSNAQMTFDGTDDSVLVGTVGNYSNNMTVEAVFKTSSSATWKNILCGSTGDIIFTVNGAKLNFGSQGSNPIPHSNYSTTDVNDGQWHHGVATYNGSQVKIYVDGVLESTNLRSGNQTPSSLRVGSNNAGSSEFFNGDIPLVKLYNRALTASEIQANYNAIKGRFNIE